jgi:alkanesulfonate monooxygenase SsuD/methylene tetrahydromethanopterin reductase-like flavin-dependent oxidoreductase (luciferase family)
MEFGLFNQMYHPAHRRQERTEQEVLREELALIEVADRVGFKYAWASEHHFLDEYSHLSASEAFMAYALARTERIHIGSGIINITPNVAHPARVAEQVAMLDHLGRGRFEFGTGRGSSSTEVFGFGIESMDVTREMYDETLPQIVRMMTEDVYGPYQGRFFSMPERPVLPKPYTTPHPPIWVAAGSPGTFEKAARLGLGVLCFTLATPDQLAPLIDLYKRTIQDAEPVGGYVNDNVMVTTDMMCLPDGGRAREVVLANRGNYHTALLLRYLDSFPIAEGRPRWPEVPPPPTPEQLDRAIEAGVIAVGDPEECIATLRRYEAIGADQLAFGTFATDVSLDDAVEAYETFGTHVLPVFDTDPVHSTVRQREAQLGLSPRP